MTPPALPPALLALARAVACLFNGRRMAALVCLCVALFASRPDATAQTATYRLLHTLNGSVEGAAPLGALLEGPDGNFYGTTSAQGTQQDGTVFELTPDGDLDPLYTFTIGNSSGINVDGAYPTARRA